MTEGLMNRREFLALSSGATLSSAVLHFGAAGTGGFAEAFRRATARVVPTDPTALGVAEVEAIKRWNGDFCATRVINHGKYPVRIKEVTLASLEHTLPRETALYGESFQMLSQTGGTLADPVDLGYSELNHYKIPQPQGMRAITGLMTLTPPNGDSSLLGFTSCKKFVGRLFVTDSHLDAVLDLENLELAPGESWELEELFFTQTAHLPDALNTLASRIEQHHPHAIYRPIPTGWCSWYFFGPRVTARNVLDNLEVIAKSIPDLKYVQIDDGYQAAMGDWLETGKAFGGDVVSVLKEIRKRGYEPAIWVAPFIAESGSHVFQQHPEWFIQDSDGKPLAADKVTFGGWRHAPWYALDGTHPEVQKHFEKVFSVMRREWGCTYFKLDANFWGAMHGGRLHDPKATRVDAYRRGMEAVRRGADDAFILGCNHPIWPSFGLIDGSRSSDDISRKWQKFKGAGRQTLCRNWQNGRLWWNDPDAVLLSGTLSDAEFQFHATVIYACGGMVLSGDDLTQITPTRLAMLKKLVPPAGVAAEFSDASLNVGLVHLRDATMACLFNWEDGPGTVSFQLPKASNLTDFWTGENLGRREGLFTVQDMPQHSARLIKCE